MIKNRLNILFNLIINTSDSEEEVHSYFINKGENPFEILKRAADFIYRKEEEIKLRNGKAEGIPTMSGQVVQRAEGARKV